MFYARSLNLCFLRSGCIVNSHYIFARSATRNVPADETSFMVSKTSRGTEVSNLEEKPEPWPYLKKKLSFMEFLSSPVKRFHCNSKLIVIDGLMASRKHDLAEKLADEFQMVCVPSWPTAEQMCSNHTSLSSRHLTYRVPYSTQFTDINDFLMDPHDSRLTVMQTRMSGYKLEQYVDAVAHLLNTGQGVVLVRSLYSDLVYVRALAKAGYINKHAFDYLKTLNFWSLKDLIMPNLMIYIDSTEAECIHRVKNRRFAYEQYSPLINDHNYISYLRASYHDYVARMRTRTNTLVFSLADTEDLAHCVRCVERLEFDMYDDQVGFKQCSVYLARDHPTVRRLLYTYRKHQLLQRLCIGQSLTNNLPEFCELNKFNKVLKQMGIYNTAATLSYMIVPKSTIISH